ncbi:MAG: hypothetical protein TREMPRED_000909 [Tremellales sp. Tagirdzhanova-0007]|nr:MAG: hypothetical protein TREMPRED_000909 [Tremellales sp. Tagirdzhanova-0007]
MHTVGVIGHNGNLGRAALIPLLGLHDSQKIKLVIFHRPSSNLSSIPAEVEKRVLDLDSKDSTAIKSAIKGINIIISMLASSAVSTQIPLVEALAGSPDLLTFIPSEYGTHWTHDEMANPKLAFLGMKDRVVDKARDLGVPVTIVHNAGFTESAFAFPTIPYLGAGIAQLVLRDGIANKTFYLVEYEVTGDEVINIFTNIHGSPPEIIRVSDATWQAQFDKGGMESLCAVVKRKWGDGNFFFEGEMVDVIGWEKKGLEAVLRQIKG